MIQMFAKSEIGYSHIKERKPLQDFSSAYSDVNKRIITCCDGHGGRLYVRSNKGSMFASKAVAKVLDELYYYYFSKFDKEELENKIALDVLCEWNKLVEKDLDYYRLSKRDYMGLNEDEIAKLKANPIKAYGTTLSGAMLYKNKLVIVKIGDGEALLVNKGELIDIFSEDDDPAGNQTYSMCQSDAFKYIRVRIVDFSDYDGIILCTDGMSSPYQSYENFNNSFIKPLFNKIINENSLNYINSFVKLVASEIGTGDDVSLAFIIDDKSNKKYYK